MYAIRSYYALEVPVDAEILSFSFVGMKTQDIVIAGQTQINITLEDETRITSYNVCYTKLLRSKQ